MKQFLIWHGEKFVVGILVLAALFFALQELTHKTVPWQPNEVVDTANRVIPL